MKNFIELNVIYDKGNSFLKIDASSENMIKIYNIFNTFSINELKGKYCRIIFNEKTNEIDCIKDIIYDEQINSLKGIKDVG